MINNKYKMSTDRLLSVPIPLETDTYKPITHREVIEVINEYSPVEVLNRTHYSVNGGYAVRSIYEFEVDEEMNGVISINNSYDKSMAFKVHIGMKVKVCDNGMFMNILNNTYRRKHVEDVQVEYKEQLLEKFSSLDAFIKSHVTARETLKDIAMTKEEMYKETLNASIYGHFGNRFNNFKKIANEIERPSFNYHNGLSRWDFYNHCTIAMNDLKFNAFDCTHRKISNHFKLETII